MKKEYSNIYTDKYIYIYIYYSVREREWVGCQSSFEDVGLNTGVSAQATLVSLRNHIINTVYATLLVCNLFYNYAATCKRKTHPCSSPRNSECFRLMLWGKFLIAFCFALSCKQLYREKLIKVNWDLTDPLSLSLSLSLFSSVFRKRQSIGLNIS